MSPKRRSFASFLWSQMQKEKKSPKTTHGVVPGRVCHTVKMDCKVLGLDEEVGDPSPEPAPPPPTPAA